MTVTLTTTSLRDQLDTLALEQRRDACGRCTGDPHHPCRRCATQRQRISELADDSRPLPAIAATVALPVWRVEQILKERDRTAAADELFDRYELLRADLGDHLVERLRAGPPAGPATSWPVQEWQLWTRLQLQVRGWNQRHLDGVLAGTHIPNRTLRAKVQEAKARHRRRTGLPLTSALLAARSGVADDGTYLDRLLGLRPTAPAIKNGRRYPGHLLPAIRIAHASAIADALGVAHYEIPGL
jgi:hypothetical protein